MILNIATTLFTGTEKIDPGFIRQLGSLTPFNIGATAKRWTSPLRDLGVNTSSIEAPIRQALSALAKQKGKPQMYTLRAEQWAAIGDAISAAAAGVEAGATLAEASLENKKLKRWEAAGITLSEIIGSFVNTPTGALILTNVNLFASNLYGVSLLIFKQRVNQITNRTESDLKSIANTFAMMKEDVAQLSMARKKFESENTIAQSTTCKQQIEAVKIEKAKHCQADCEKFYADYIKFYEDCIKKARAILDFDGGGVEGNFYRAALKGCEADLNRTRKDLKECTEKCLSEK